MKNTTERFERAFNLLYNAFENGTLDAMNCTHCAVGNLCGNSDEWKEGNMIGSEDRISKTFKNRSGYSNEELMNIETVFIYGLSVDDMWNGIMFSFNNNIPESAVRYGWRTKEEQRELQFKGLVAVLNYLAELDGIPSINSYVEEFRSLLNTPVQEKECAV